MKSFTNVHLRYILFSLLATLSLGCASQKPQLLSFEYLPAVFEHEYVEQAPGAWLINDQESYNKLLTELKMQQQDGKEFTSYWEKNSLLLVYGGTCPSGGYYIQTDSILSEGKQLQVIATLTGPGADCAVTDMITYPLQLLAIPKNQTRNEIKLVLKSKSKPCL